ncbi:hypothetical protein EJ02DRAFT_449673 [Clathrospora elynae]|uniref:Uncharacterized protein n=1 Tax=Clathrospora elynae TaxID=706981 RepID=A0A6A5TF14_9PLEO|nr:hypothetical protein EJ02DRAFT_449673 [Clathrospora elynae]
MTAIVYPLEPSYAPIPQAEQQNELHQPQQTPLANMASLPPAPTTAVQEQRPFSSRQKQIGATAMIFGHIFLAYRARRCDDRRGVMITEHQNAQGL